MFGKPIFKAPNASKPRDKALKALQTFKIKISFTKDGETIKEIVDTSQYGDPLDCLIATKLHVLQLRRWNSIAQQPAEFSQVHACMNGIRRFAQSGILKWAS